jgi:GNAT superfamily N-acetyltransferase
VDVERRAGAWRLDGSFVAVAEGRIVGSLTVEATPFGFGELGMMVASDWRSRMVGSALVAAAIDWSLPPRPAQAHARGVPGGRAASSGTCSRWASSSS